MVYVQYYDYQGAEIKGVPYLSEVLGDRGVVILDGRNSLENMHAHAHFFNGNKRPRFHSYRLFKGRSFMDSQPITDMEEL